MKNYIKREFICPFCFDTRSLKTIKFRCQSDPKRCANESDKIYTDFMGMQNVIHKKKVILPPPSTGKFDSLKSAIKPKGEAICPDCNQKSTHRICPSCHSDLPYTIGEHKDLIIAVVGAKETGKSHYVCMLIEKLKNEIGTAFNALLQPVNDQTMKRYREDFYNPIFKKRVVIQATQSARIDNRVLTPLIFILSFMGKGLLSFAKQKIINVATVVFFDTAGEDLDSEDLMATENRYIFNSSGIILLLDPLQLPEVRSLLPANTPLPAENTEAEDILTRIANLIRRSKNMAPTELIDIPIAVSFSKMDAVETLLPAASNLKYPSKHSGKFNLDEFENVNAEMEALIQKWSSDFLIQQLQHNFKHHACFGLSALGCNPHADNKISKLRPNRVEDPFLWLLWKNKQIRAESSQ